MSVLLKLGLDGCTRWFISAGFRKKQNKDRGNVLLLTMKHLLCNLSESCLLHNMHKKCLVLRNVWLQRAGHCLGGREGSIGVEQAVSRVEELERSLMNVNGVPNSNLGIFYRLSFKCTKDRSEEGQKYSLVFEEKKILFRHFLSIRTICESAGRHPTVGLYAITCHVQPSCWWFTIIFTTNHTRFSPKKSAIKQNIF